MFCQNKKASFSYEFVSLYQAGIVLTGSEIKSVREGHMSINEAFCVIRRGQVYLKNAYIKQYIHSYSGYQTSSEETRDRVLLLKKHEINAIKSKMEEKGLTLVPTKAYIDNQYLKLEIALARGKKLYDKRETIKKRDVNRQINRHLSDMGMK